MELSPWPREVTGGHILQLFDNADSVAEAVSTFVGQSLAADGTALVVIDPDDWERTDELLGSRSAELDRAMRDGRLVVQDGDAMLQAVTRQGVPEPALFDRTVGRLVRRLASRGSRLSVYGDMVNRLAERGAFRAAATLEDLWNQLRTEHPFTLLCGYSSVHFGDPRSAAALRRICECHSQVWSNPSDMLGDYLLGQHRSAPMHTGTY